MAVAVSCDTCGARRRIPSELYAARFAGKRVVIRCKSCQAAIVVDDTAPKPAAPMAPAPSPVGLLGSLPESSRPTMPDSKSLASPPLPNLDPDSMRPTLPTADKSLPKVPTATGSAAAEAKSEASAPPDAAELHALEYSSVSPDSIVPQALVAEAVKDAKLADDAPVAEFSKDAKLTDDAPVAEFSKDAKLADDAPGAKVSSEAKHADEAQEPAPKPAVDTETKAAVAAPVKKGLGTTSLDASWDSTPPPRSSDKPAAPAEVASKSTSEAPNADAKPAASPEPPAAERVAAPISDKDPKPTEPASPEPPSADVPKGPIRRVPRPVPIRRVSPTGTAAQAVSVDGSEQKGKAAEGSASGNGADGDAALPPSDRARPVEPGRARSDASLRAVALSSEAQPQTPERAAPAPSAKSTGKPPTSTAAAPAWRAPLVAAVLIALGLLLYLISTRADSATRAHDATQPPAANAAAPTPAAQLPQAPAPTEPAPTADSAAPGAEAPPPSSVTPLSPRDEMKLEGALNWALRKAEECHRDGRAVGTSKVIVTFGPNGKVSDARLEGEPIASAPVGSCVLMHMRQIIVPPFEGPPFSVARDITLR